jgi:predicted nucleic acid-binding protein
MKPPRSSAKTVTDKVVDASAIVALLFNELTRESVTSWPRGASLHAPSLLEFELANAEVRARTNAPD